MSSQITVLILVIATCFFVLVFRERLFWLQKENKKINIKKLLGAHEAKYSQDSAEDPIEETQKES